MFILIKTKIHQTVIDFTALYVVANIIFQVWLSKERSVHIVLFHVDILCTCPKRAWICLLPVVYTCQVNRENSALSFSFHLSCDNIFLVDFWPPYSILSLHTQQIKDGREWLRKWAEDVSKERSPAISYSGLPNVIFEENSI